MDVFLYEGLPLYNFFFFLNLHWVSVHTSISAMLKVVWMNEDMAVTYWCFNAGRGDPWCQDQAHVSVLSRQREKGKDLPAYLQPVIVDICVASQDFFTTDSGIVKPWFFSPPSKWGNTVFWRSIGKCCVQVWTENTIKAVSFQYNSIQLL